MAATATYRLPRRARCFQAGFLLKFLNGVIGIDLILEKTGYRPGDIAERRKGADKSACRSRYVYHSFDDRPAKSDEAGLKFDDLREKFEIKWA
jgi:hypothetical protein